jgi:hypothetical protein
MESFLTGQNGGVQSELPARHELANGHRKYVLSQGYRLGARVL